MDGRRRIVEPVTDGALPRLGSGAPPGGRRASSRAHFEQGRCWTERWQRLLAKPIGQWRVPRGVGVAAALVFLLASAGFGAVRGGHLPELIEGLRDVRDSIANAAGFRITSIALAGGHQLTRDEILGAAGITDRTSLLFLDAAETRARLMANPWIGDANILKLYPGRLHISITEREAFALWQKDGQVSVIARDGTVVAPYAGQDFGKLPMVVGAGAAARANDFVALVDRYPPIHDRMRAAVLVAERRWNLILDNGIAVRLPETGAEQALRLLVKLDQDDKLLTRDIAAVDLRLPDRVTVQLSDEAAAARQEALKAKYPKRKGGAA